MNRFQHFYMLFSFTFIFEFHIFQCVECLRNVDVDIVDAEVL